MQDFSASRPNSGLSEQKITDVIRRLAAVGFSDIFNDETSAQHKMPVIKVGEQQYRVLGVEESVNDTSKEFSVFRSNPKNEPASDSASLKGETRPESSPAQHEPLLEEVKPVSAQLGVHPGFAIFLNPINPKEFLEKLPSSLRAFVEDAVKIIKQKYQDGLTQYRFSFSELKLDIVFENGKDGMVIRIFSDEEEAKKSFLNKDNQGLLFAALQQEFPDEQVVVLFEQMEALNQHFSGESGQDGRRNNDSEQQDDEENN